MLFGQELKQTFERACGAFDQELTEGFQGLNAATTIVLYSIVYPSAFSF